MNVQQNPRREAGASRFSRPLIRKKGAPAFTNARAEGSCDEEHSRAEEADQQKGQAVC